MKKFNWTPYLLLLPTALYLIIFFAWPMLRAFQLAIRGGGESLLEIYQEADENGSVVGQLSILTPITIVEYRKIERDNPNSQSEQFGTIQTDWYRIQGADKNGTTIEGWARFSSLDLEGARSPARRTRIHVDNAPLYRNPDPASEVVTQIPVDEQVEIFGYTPIESDYEVDWYLVLWEDENDHLHQGWITIDMLAIGQHTIVMASNLYTQPAETSDAIAEARANTTITLLGRHSISGEEHIVDWYLVRGEDFEGWVPVNSLDLGQATLISTEATAIFYTVPSLTEGETLGESPTGNAVTLLGRRLADDGQSSAIWYYGESTDTAGNPIRGWVRLDNLDLEVAGLRPALAGRVKAGNTTESSFTTSHLQRMINHNRFDDALITTFLLIIIILPLQFTVAIIMALLLQARLRGGTIFLYIYAIPLGVSDLATGLIWFSIFTQNGFLNSFLRSLGLIDRNFIFLSLDHREWLIIAVVLAEVWRATSIVMVIVVSGLQAVPSELIEAGEIFGANLWQRLRHIVLPLLKPSLQVALILRTILAFQVFAVVLAITGDGLTVLAAEAYDWYSIRTREEVAAAYAGLIMLLSLGISMFYLRAVRSQEEAVK